jgi:chorismate mutase
VESCGKGVIRTEYNAWMQNIVGPESMISILRLREDLQAKFNATAAAEWFTTVEGRDREEVSSKEEEKEGEGKTIEKNIVGSESMISVP